MHQRSTRARFTGICALAAVMHVATAAHAQISFTKSDLQGESSNNPTTLQFGPDDRLYVGQQNGLIYAYTVVRNGVDDYAVTATETLSHIRNIPNHDDDGSLNASETNRQLTGILVTGTAINPVIYASSSDPRISVANDSGLDTNSGMITRLTWNGASWDQLDLVRGLPRSEENHGCHGMQLDEATGILYVAHGGHTNQGAPSNNFSFTPEYALSAAILAIDLNAIGESTYDVPTLDDPSRPNTGPGGSDENDPFGGNDGDNQAIIVPGGPVQIHSPGWRNPYDLLITQSGRMYSVDNGSNNGWGGIPVNEGPGGTCTNGVNESGSATHDDGLHFISAPGYYAGHPNPTRASTANTFNGQSPVPFGNPIECDYQEPGVDDGSLTVWGFSTNGLCEYTASNFSGELQGDLLAAGWNGSIQRVELNAAGDVATNVETLFTSVGNNTLDVIAQGDADFLPGTVWAVNHGSDEIVVFEPADLFSCTGADDPGLDEDSDGFTNADEIDNGTNPCSAGDTPPDNDGDFVSDLNDPDDDNDGLPDTSDPFAIDPHNGWTTPPAINYGWAVGDPGFGLLSLGFTGLMTNGVTDYADLYDPETKTAGGAAGKFTVNNVTAGTALGASNDQEKGYQLGINMTQATGLVTVRTRIESPYFDGQTPQDDQSMGLFIGTGSQDNYVAITVAAGGGAGEIEVVHEESDVSSTNAIAAAVLATTAVDLAIVIDTIAGTAQPRYALDGGAEMDAGPPLLLAGELLAAVQGMPTLAAGLISTSSGASSFAATWDKIEVSVAPSTAEAFFEIDPPGTSIDASTFGNGSFKITNNATGGQTIVSISLDLRTAIFPDMVYDPDGLAGDTTAKAFTPNSGTSETGLVDHTLSLPHDDGYDVLDITFNDFDPGEQFTFSIDNDPTSIRGTSAPGPNDSGSVSGLELAGSTIRVTFDDGTTHINQVFLRPGTVEASEAILRANPPPAPMISVLGVPSPPATVVSASQVVRVIGVPGADIKLIIAEGGLFTQGLPGGGFDLDPYESNSALGVTEIDATIGTDGTVEIPVTLVDSDPDGGINHLASAIIEPDGRTGAISNVIVLQLDDTLAQPSVAATVPAAGATNVSRDTAVVAEPLNLPNGEAVDPATFGPETVFLTRTQDGGLIPSSINLDGAGAIFTLQPTTLLDPNTSYTFNVTSGLRDLAGVGFTPFTATFTTGTSGGGVDPGPADFDQVALPETDGAQYTSLAFGPDGLLYGLTNDGEIRRWPINPDGTTGTVEIITSLQTAEGGDRLAIGMAFDPASDAGNSIMWVSHTTHGFSNMPDWGGKITRLTGANLETVEDIVVGLPRSSRDHVTNGLAFGPDGALYFLQGSNSAMGAPDAAWDNRPERLLTAAVLRLDPTLVPTPPLDAQTTEGGSYDPYAPAAPLTVYASGTRNAYDLVWHSNGQLYVPTNGSASGGNTPAGSAGASCGDGSTYGGPSVPALSSVGLQSDYLYRVEAGRYYGHPNPTRCEFVLNGGNPTAGSDPEEVDEYPVATAPSSNYAGIAFDFGTHRSPNGIIEYNRNHFGGELQGKLLIVRYSSGDDIIALTPGGPTFDIVQDQTGISGFTGFSNPLDLVESPNSGFLYISEYGASRITLLRPVGILGVSEIDITTDELVFSGVKGTTSDPQSILIENLGTVDLTITALSIGGNDAADFALQNPPATPFNVAPGASVPIDAVFAPGLSSVGSLSAFLRVESDDGDEPMIDVGLYGLSANGLEGSNEPPLHNVVTTLGHAIDVGGTQLALGTDPNPIGEEVVQPLFQKAGPGNVIMTPVARYSPAFALPFGWYEPNGATPILHEVGELSGSSSPPEHQTLFPELTSGSSAFDPGSAIFGFYTTSPSHSAYTEDSLNAQLHPSNAEHAARVYPLKDRNGIPVANAYLVGFEEASNGDYQDYVFTIFNVTAGVPGAETLMFAPDVIGFSLSEGPNLDSAATTVTASDATTPSVTLSAEDDATMAVPTWLSIPPSVTAGNAITVDVDATGLVPGAYSATITGTAAGFADATLSVSLTVSAVGGGGDDLLFVVPDPANLNGQDQARVSLFQGFGYAVNLIAATDSQSAFDAAVLVNDVAYITETVASGNLGTKLTPATFGVVCEEGFLYDAFGIASDNGAVFAETQINVVDNSHYITAPFLNGSLTLVSATDDLREVSGTLAPGLQVLAERLSNATPTLAVLDSGADLFGGGTAAGRRVALPWGGGGFDVGLLTADAITLLQRALQWAADESNTPPMPTTLIFQDGTNGYGATHDTFLHEGSPNAIMGSAEDWEWDGADAGGENVGLLKFESIIGNGANQVPAGSIVTTATLTLQVFDVSANPPGDIHQGLTAWDEATATWNNFGGDAGVQVDEYGALVGTAPVSTGPFAIDVTATVQDWVDGTIVNEGWVFLPNSTNGLQVRSSEYQATPIERPSLSVTYIVPCSTPTIDTHPLAEEACEGESTTLTVAASGTAPLNYQWRKNGSNLVGENSQALNLSSVSLTDTGSYDVEVTNACGTVISNAAQVTIHPNPTISVSALPAETVCAGDPITLDAGDFGPTATYAWSPGGETTRTIDVFSSGNYAVSVLDENGCIGNDDIDVVVLPAQVPGDINIDLTVDGHDIGLFVGYVLSPGNSIDSGFCAADLNNDGMVAMDDVAPFVSALLGS